MGKRLFYYFRICATGICFICFGVGGILLSYGIVPFASLFPGKIEKKWARSQRVIHYCFRLFVSIMRWVGVLSIKVTGTERLTSNENYLILANHPTLIDVVLLISILPEVDCVIKEELYRNKFVKNVLKAAGYISNETPESLINACVSRIKNGNSLLIFPEGTRSEQNELRKFQRGAAIIAVQSACKILPVFMTCNPPTLMKGQKWYEIPEDRCEIRLAVGEPIDVKKVIPDCRTDQISARKLTSFLQEYFEKRVDNGKFEKRA